MATVRFDPAGALRGALRPPPDKSVSHRAALIAAMGEGETTIEGYLDAADTRSTLAAVEALGADVTPIGRCVSRASACAAPRRPRSTSATPAPCCACCPAGSPVRRPARGRSTATSRSAAAPWTGWPSRCV